MSTGQILILYHSMAFFLDIIRLCVDVNSSRPEKVVLSNLASTLGFLSEFNGSTCALMILYKVMKFIDNDSMCDNETCI